MLLLSHFSRVRLCATPEMAAHQAPLSLGFSRKEHWSGLPFPSPFPIKEIILLNYTQSESVSISALLVSLPFAFMGFHS